MVLSSCTDTDNTGDLYGSWKLTSIKEDGQILSEPRNIYLGFQGEVFFVRYADLENYTNSYSPGKFKESDGTLVMSFFIGGESDRKKLKERLFIEGTTIENGIEERFSLEKSKDAFTLSSGNKRWYFRRFLTNGSSSYHIKSAYLTK